MYELDGAKNCANLSKHGLSFEDAPGVFSGPCMTFEDTRYDYDESRFVTLALLAERVVVIAHTQRD